MNQPKLKTPLVGAPQPKAAEEGEFGIQGTSMEVGAPVAAAPDDQVGLDVDAPAEPASEAVMAERRLAHYRSANESTDLMLVCAYIQLRSESIGETLGEMQQHPFAEYAGRDDMLSDELSHLQSAIRVIANAEEGLAGASLEQVLALRDNALYYLLSAGKDIKEIRAIGSSALLEAFRANKVSQAPSPTPEATSGFPVSEGQARILMECHQNFETRTFAKSEVVVSGYKPEALHDLLDILADKGLVDLKMDGRGNRVGWTINPAGVEFIDQCRIALNTPFGEMTEDSFQSMPPGLQELFLHERTEQFTRRTEDPKLAYLEDRLTKAGIPHVRHGDSFHAPLLWVQKEKINDARAILGETVDRDDQGRENIMLDEVNDRDSRFYGFDVTDMDPEEFDMDEVKGLFKPHNFFGN